MSNVISLELYKAAKETTEGNTVFIIDSLAGLVDDESNIIDTVIVDEVTVEEKVTNKAKCISKPSSLWRKDRSTYNNLKRCWYMVSKLVIMKLLYNVDNAVEDSHFNLIKGAN